MHGLENININCFDMSNFTFLFGRSLLDHLARALQVGHLLLQAGLLILQVGDHRLHVRLALMRELERYLYYNHP